MNSKQKIEEKINAIGKTNNFQEKQLLAKKIADKVNDEDIIGVRFWKYFFYSSTSNCRKSKKRKNKNYSSSNIK